MKKPLVIARENLKNAKINILGDMLSYYVGNGLYLSGSASFNTGLFNFHSTTKSISSYYPPFSGRPVPYEVVNNSQIRFNLPEDMPLGNYDIIFCNPAGYYKASRLSTFTTLSVVALSSF